MERSMGEDLKPCGLNQGPLRRKLYCTCMSIRISWTSLHGPCKVSLSLGQPVTITDQQLPPSDLTLPLKRHAFLSFALTKTRVWPLLFALDKKTMTDPLLPSGTFTSSASNSHFPSHPPPFCIYKAANKAISIHLPCHIYLASFFKWPMWGYGVLFTLISCYLWA